MALLALKEKINELKSVTVDSKFKEYAVTDHSILSRTAMKNFIRLGRQYILFISKVLDDPRNMEEEITEEEKEELFVTVTKDELYAMATEASSLLRAIKAKVSEVSTYFSQAFNRTNSRPAFGLEDDRNVLDEEVRVGRMSEEDSLVEDRALEDSVTEVPRRYLSPPTNSSTVDVKPRRKGVTSDVLFAEEEGAPRFNSSPVSTDFTPSPPIACSTTSPNNERPSWLPALLKSFAESQRMNQILMEQLLARQSDATLNSCNHSQGPRMKELSLTPFSGENPEEWEGWWAMFQVMIGNSNMAYEAKMVALKNYVTKIARDAIDDLSLSKEGYEMACSLLNERFKFEGLCRNYPLEKLQNLATTSVPNNAKALTRFYYQQYACLQKIKLRAPLGSVHMYLMKEPYPLEIQREFRAKEIRYVQKHDMPMPVEEFLKMVLRTIQVFAVTSSRAEDIQSINHFSEDRNNHDTAQPNARSRSNWRCRLCHQSGHYEHWCPRYPTLEARIQFVQDENLCSLCYTKNEHYCKRRECPKCNGPHGLATCPNWQDNSQGPSNSFRG